MILDGWNLPGVLRDGSSDFRFVYRPMLAHERRQFLRLYRGWSEEGARDAKCRWLARHLVAVDEPQALTHLADLYAADENLFGRLHHVLLGLAPPDDAQHWSPRWESERIENLQDGVQLALLNPQYDHQLSPLAEYRLSERNRVAWNHFRLCEATGRFPDDPLVEQTALVVRQVMKGLGHARPGSAGGGGSTAMARQQQPRTRPAAGGLPANEFDLFGGVPD